MRHSARSLAAAVTGLLVLSACAVLPRRGTAPSPVALNARVIADSVFTEPLAKGVTLHRLVSNAAPWRASVLEVDLTACVSLRAVKGGSTAVGRRTTSALLASIDASLRPIAAVNADFFLFAPPGVPVGPHIENGTLISGPIDRGVFGMLANNVPWIGRLSVTGQVSSSRGSAALTTWNRPSATAAGVVDAAWGVPLDSNAVRTAWLLSPLARDDGANRRYIALPLSASRAAGTGSVVGGDTLLLVGVRTVSAGGTNLTRVGALTLYRDDTLRITRAIGPVSPHNAVGGLPILMRDSVVLGAVDSVNNAAFRGLNPRTAVGYGNNGKRVLVAVIDGRQPKYSVGMSLRHTAELFRSLGATHAINLDGGGSSAMVVADAKAPNRSRLVTHPSDSAGERAVANALAVLQSCR